MIRVGPSGSIAHYFLKNKLTLLIVISSLLLGLFAALMTPREEEPQIVVPMVDVIIPFPGATPQEVEQRAVARSKSFSGRSPESSMSIRPPRRTSVW